MRSTLKTQNRKLAFIALGSNLGNSQEIIYQAIGCLQEFSLKPLRKSSLWKSSPVNCPPGSPDFVNAMVAIAPLDGETPESLLEKLQQMEKEFGRRPKKILNEARPLDLDLISFGDETRNTPDLILPHPCFAERRFVLEPLNEIAPDLVLSGHSKTVRELLADLKTDETLTRLFDVIR